MQEENKYQKIPQPNDIPTREREDAMGSYFMMFAAMAAGLPLPILNLIAAIIYYYINKKKSPFVHFHALQSLISQLPTSLMNIGLVFWTVRNFYFDLDFTQIYFGYLAAVLIANLLYFIMSIVAAVAARKGRMYYFLFFGPISYKVAFKKHDDVEKVFENKAPKL